MRVLVIGSGVGGLACAIRLAAKGLQVLVLEKLDGPGGRARVRRAEGFTFDMGPAVITVPPFLEDLFATGPGTPRLYPDFPEEEGLKATERTKSTLPPPVRRTATLGSSGPYKKSAQGKPGIRKNRRGQGRLGPAVLGLALLGPWRRKSRALKDSRR